MFEEKLEEASSEFERFNLVRYLESDELKLKYLSWIKSESYVALIIASMSEDAVKISYLSKIHDNYNQYIIIKSFFSDTLKYQYVTNIIDEQLRVRVIITITNDEYKEELLKNIKSMFLRAKIIASFKSDDRKKKYLSSLENASLRNVLVSFSNDLDKIDYLDLLEDEDIAKVIDSFHSDEAKLQYLNPIQNEENRISVIAQFKLLTNMMLALEDIHDYIIKLSIINYISDEIKLELICLSKGEFRASLIASLSDSSNKLKLLDLVLSLKDTMIVLMSLPDDLKEKYICKLPYHEKMALIYSLKSKDKREYYRSLYERKLNFDLGIDSKLLFGLEIETEGINESIVKELESDKTGFRCSDDGTLVLGVEVKTPKLKNLDECLNEFYYVCNMLEMGGFKTSSRAGGHIHFDSSYFTSKEDYYGLFEIWTSVEDILYIILNDVSSLPRSDVTGFASPFIESIQNQKEMVFESFSKDDDGFASDLHLWQNDKHNGLNLTHVKTDLNTIEFRVPNGTISFPVWMQNIKFLGRLMMISKRLSDIYQGKTADLDTMRLWNLKERLKINITHGEKLEILLEMLFREPERDVYRRRFSVNYQLLEENDNPLKEMCFQQLNLSKKIKFY